MDDADAMIAKASYRQGGMDFGFVADEIQGGDLLIGLEGAFGAFNDHTAPVVATHDIHCDSHKAALDAKKAAPAEESARLPL
jgi:hypothetical protein